MEHFSSVPNRVGISSGPEKPRANIGAARSSLLNVLITDEHTAGKMLAILDEEEPAPVPAREAHSSRS